MHRKRKIVFLLFCVCIAFGFMSRMPLPLPSLFQQFGGDVLWAAMIYFGLAFLAPACPAKRLLMTTLLFSYLVEASQLLQWDWLVYLRTTPLHYILGQGFLWSDLLCYTIGVCAAAALDTVLFREDEKNG